MVDKSLVEHIVEEFAAGMQRIEQSRAEILLIVRIYNADIRWRICQNRRMTACIDPSGIGIKADPAKQHFPHLLPVLDLNRRKSDVRMSLACTYFPGGRNEKALEIIHGSVQSFAGKPLLVVAQQCIIQAYRSW